MIIKSNQSKLVGLSTEVKPRTLQDFSTLFLADTGETWIFDATNARWIKQDFTGTVVSEYTISYDLDGGVIATANPTVYTNTDENIVLTNPTKEGFTFAGWIGTGLLEATVEVTIATGATGTRAYVATFTEVEE